MHAVFAIQDCLLAIQERQQRTSATENVAMSAKSAFNFTWSNGLVSDLSTVSPTYVGGLQEIMKRIPYAEGQQGSDAQGYWQLTEVLDETCSKVLSEEESPGPVHAKAELAGYRKKMKAWLPGHPLSQWRAIPQPPISIGPYHHTMLHKETDITQTMMFSSMSPIIETPEGPATFLNDGNAAGSDDWSYQKPMIRDRLQGGGRCRLQSNVINKVSLDTMQLLSPVYSRSLSSAATSSTTGQLRRNIMMIQPLQIDGSCTLYVYSRSLQRDENCQSTCVDPLNHDPSNYRKGITGHSIHMPLFENCCAVVHHHIEQIDGCHDTSSFQVKAGMPDNAKLLRFGTSLGTSSTSIYTSFARSTRKTLRPYRSHVAELAVESLIETNEATSLGFWAVEKTTKKMLKKKTAKNNKKKTKNNEKKTKNNEKKTKNNKKKTKNKNKKTKKTKQRAPLFLESKYPWLTCQCTPVFVPHFHKCS